MAERQVDEAKASAPVRAADLYLIASRLKRLVTASTAVMLANVAGDQEGRDKQMREFQLISLSLEPLLDNLVYESEADGE